MIRKGLVECVNWNDYGVEVAGEVANGKKALEFLQNNPVDIVLTDVAMPQMDGIELVKNIRDAQMNVKVIFVSGHTDLPYLKKALKLDAIDYIIKPVKLDELDAVLIKIVGLYEQEKKQKETFEELKQKLEESMPVLKERFISALLKRSIGEQDYIARRLRFLGLPFECSDKFTVISMDISMSGEMGSDAERQVPENLEKMEMGLISLSTDRMQTGSKRYNSLSLVEDDSVYACVLSSENILTYDESIEIAKNIQQYFFLKTGYLSAVGIGKEADGIDRLHYSYAQSKKALEQKYFLGQDAVIHFNDLEKTNIKVGLELTEQKESIISCIRLGQKEDAEKAVDQLFKVIQEPGTANMQYVKNMCIELTVLAEKEFLEMKISDSSRWQGKYLWSNIPNHHSFEETRLWLKKQFGEMADTIRSVKSTTVVNFTGMMVKFVDENYKRDITIHTLANEFFITSNYVCLLFKKETGITFNDYLTKVRMEKAKEVLRNPRLKVYEIAEMVGYHDVDYFGKLFKKDTGMTISKYRGGITV
jgi:two-component system response regulator YesN